MSKYYSINSNTYRVSLIILAIMVLKTFNIRAQEQFAKLHYPFEINQLELDNQVTIAYADEGDKKDEVILLIHGLGSYAPAWKYNVQALSSNYRCIIVDLPGYGKSSKAYYEADMSFHSKYLFQLMEKLGIESFHIAGHSMGGQIAITMALDKPAKIKSLVLVAPAGIETFTEAEVRIFKSTTSPKNLAAVTDEQYRKNLSLNFYEMDERAAFMYEDRLLIKSDPQIMAYFYTVSTGVMGMLNEAVFDRLQDIEASTLIVYGKQDQLIPNKYLHPQLNTEKIGQLAAEQIPNAQLEMIDEAGHFVHFEKPETINELIINFLQNN